MKYLQLVAVVFVLFFLGYVLGPTIAPMLVKEQQPETKVVKEGGPEEGSPAGQPAPVAPTPQPQPQPQPVDPVDPVAVVTPEPMPEPVAIEPKPVEPEPKPEPVAVVPDPQPEPEPQPVGGNLSDEEIVELMKKSIAGGAVKEFSLDQVKGWKATGEETVDGTSYQTGLAAYEAETIFGVRPVQAKALIKDGKVERWVYAKSGMEIQ